MSHIESILDKTLDIVSELKKQIMNALNADSVVSRIESSIISVEPGLRQDQINFLLKELNQPKGIDLIFRASQYEFSAK